MKRSLSFAPFVVVVAAVIAGIAGIGGAAGCQSSSTDAPDQQWAMVQNHFYIDHLPRNERDMVRNIAFIDHEDAGKVGVRGMTSRFRFFVDVFTWKRDGARVLSKILQTNQDVRGTFHAWKCKKGDAPPQAELCLELKEGDKTHRFFSRHDWIIEGTSTNAIEQRVSELSSKLPVDPNASGPLGDDDVRDLPVDTSPVTE